MYFTVAIALAILVGFLAAMILGRGQWAWWALSALMLFAAGIRDSGGESPYGQFSLGCVLLVVGYLHAILIKLPAQKSSNSPAELV